MVVVKCPYCGFPVVVLDEDLVECPYCGYVFSLDEARGRERVRVCPQ